MKILKITTDGLLEPMVALPIEKNEKVYYNIFHGDKECWEYRCAIDSRIALPKLNKDLILKEDHFIFRYLTDENDNNILDQTGNKYIVISKNSNPGHKADSLIFWEVPVGVRELEYSIDGFANEIGSGYKGDKENKVPAPVLDVYGDCKLSYTGYLNDKNITVTLMYIHKNNELKRM